MAIFWLSYCLTHCSVERYSELKFSYWTPPSNRWNNQFHWLVIPIDSTFICVLQVSLNSLYSNTLTFKTKSNLHSAILQFPINLNSSRTHILTNGKSNNLLNEMVLWTWHHKFLKLINYSLWTYKFSCLCLETQDLGFAVDSGVEQPDGQKILDGEPSNWVRMFGRLGCFERRFLEQGFSTWNFQVTSLWEVWLESS